MGALKLNDEEEKCGKEDKGMKEEVMWVESSVKATDYKKTKAKNFLEDKWMNEGMNTKENFPSSSSSSLLLWTDYDFLRKSKIIFFISKNKSKVNKWSVARNFFL